ncbi:hypothetical protein [Moritella viscosa]|uniref:hypothetical protein n=1 Tax=Moritella viscosa TaxID=80854 RepID=UPI000921193C|nr:hypothetical protein [Moritella viscosa]SGY98786.1 Putative uncharacterized protein [Moritella viscosa]
MDNFQAIGQLVIKAQDLLDSIKGGAIRVMQTQFDALKVSMQSSFNTKMAAYNAQIAAATAPTADLTSKFMLSPNPRAMELITDSTVPKKWAIRAQVNIVESLIITGSKDRPVEQKAFLAQLHEDVRAAYPTFNGSEHNYTACSMRAVRVVWDFSAQTEFRREHIIIPQDVTSGEPLFLNQLVTHAAFVKCISGELSLQDNVKSNGSKWTWLRQLYGKTARLGDYIHPCIIAHTRVGEAWVLLPGHAAGNITDPNDWFGLPELK